MQTPFRVVVADPAWKFKDKLPGPKRGAVKHYKSVMTDGEVLAYLPGLEMNREVELAQDCVLFLWRVPAMGRLAYLVLKTWGFGEKSEMVWLKLTKHGKRHFGMGRSVRMAHLAIIGSHAVNGVAGLHSQILKQVLFRDFDRIYPGKLTNVTNGITPRRWLYQANPVLTQLISDAIGSVAGEVLPEGRAVDPHCTVTTELR